MTQFDHSISGKDPGFSGNSVSGSAGQGFDNSVPPAGGTQVLFSMLNGDSSVDNLPKALTINGTTVEASFFVQAKNISGSTWTADAGGDMTLTGSGGAPTLDQDTPLTNELDRSMKGSTNDHGYLADAATTCDIAEEDFVFEFFIRTPLSAPAYQYVCNKRANGAGAGYTFAYQAAGGNLVTTWYDGTNTRVTTLSLTGGIGVWHHVLIFKDYSEASNTNFRAYVNGTIAAQVDGSNIGSLTNAKKFGIAYGENFAASYDGNIAFFGMWKKTGWFPGGATNGTQWLAFARERTQRLSGFWPDIARGSGVLSSMTRASYGYLDKIDVDTDVRTLFYMGRSWPRICRRKDIYKNVITGFMPGNIVTNEHTYSQEFSNADWTRINLTSVTDDAVASPENLTNAASLVADVTAGNHGLVQSVTLTAVKCTTSIWAKVGDKLWLNIENATQSVSVYFNIFEGYVGTITGTATARIENWGNGWFRCMVTYTGFAGANSIRFYPAEADGDDLFSGDASTVTVYLFGAQTEKADKARSYVLSEATAGASTNEDFKFNPADNFNTSGGTILGRMYIDSPVSALNGAIATLSDGGSINDRITVDFLGATGAPQLIVTDGGVTQASIGGSSDVRSGALWAMRGTWKANDFHLYINGTEEGTPDTSGTVTDDIDQLRVGVAQNAGGGNYQLVDQVKILSKPSQTLEPADEVIPLATGTYYISTHADTTLNTTAVKVEGTTTSLNLVDFTHSDNRLTYSGTETKKFQVSVGFSMATSTGARVLEFSIAKNGTILEHSKGRRKVGTAGDVGRGAFMASVELATTDYVEVYCLDETGANTINASQMTVIAVELSDA